MPAASREEAEARATVFAKCDGRGRIWQVHDLKDQLVGEYQLIDGRVERIGP